MKRLSPSPLQSTDASWQLHTLQICFTCGRKTIEADDVFFSFSGQCPSQRTVSTPHNTLRPRIGQPRRPPMSTLPLGLSICERKTNTSLPRQTRKRVGSRVDKYHNSCVKRGERLQFAGIGQPTKQSLRKVADWVSLQHQQRQLVSATKRIHT